MEQEEKEACEEDGANGIHRGERNLQGEDAKENILITEDI